MDEIPDESELDINRCEDLPEVTVTNNRAYSSLPEDIHEGKPPCPFDGAFFLSILTFSWCTKYFLKAIKTTLEQSDLFQIVEKDSAKTNAKRLEQLWQQELDIHGKEGATFTRVISRFIWKDTLRASLVLFICLAASFSNASVVVRRLLDYAESTESNIYYGFLLVCFLFIFQIITIVFMGLTWYLSTRAATRLRGATIAAIYRKTLCVRSLRGKSTGEIVNLCTNDGQRVFDMMMFLPFLFIGPILAMVCLVYTTALIGPAAIIGTGVFFLFYPLQLVMSKVIAYFRTKGIIVTDCRVKMMNEIITCIKLIKMYAWEKSFAKSIAGIRAQEQSVLEKAGYIQSINNGLTPLIPVLATVITLSVHTFLGNSLNPAQAFTYIACLNATRVIVAVTPASIRYLGETKVTTTRMKELFILDEVQAHTDKPETKMNAIEIKNATFAWDKETFVSKYEEKLNFKPVRRNSKVLQRFGRRNSKTRVTKTGNEEENSFLVKSEEEFVKILFDINLTIKKGYVLGICGSVGCGKSSLLSAVLNFPIKQLGKVAVDGSIAYVSQQPWIINDSLCENILFGKKMSQEKYEQVLFACSLQQDIDMLPNGDKTEIGERGVNLSGGQKQRISLARALYADSDIYLLDDPLSAVDSHVGLHIFNNYILNGLKEKTVLFVTHQLQYLDRCDDVILMKDGCIIQHGTHKFLMSQNGAYAALLQTFYNDFKEPKSSSEYEEENQFQDMLQKHNLSVPPKEICKDDHQSLQTFCESEECIFNDGKLIQEEEKSEGTVGLKTYKAYIEAAGGYIVTLFVLLLFIVTAGCSTFSNWWLSYWLNQQHTEDYNVSTSLEVGSIYGEQDTYFYQIVYILSAVVFIFLICLRSFFYTNVTLGASSRMHDIVFKRVVTCPMSFFDTNPLGRILNRFSKDLDEVDVRLPFVMEPLIQNSILILLSMSSIIAVFPWFLIPVFVMLIFFVFLVKLFRHGIREIKKLDNITRSFWFSHINTTILGLQTIWAFKKGSEYIAKFDILLDENSVALCLFYFANRWLAIRFDLLTCIMSVSTAVLVVVTHGVVPASLAGLALSYSTQMLGIFQYTVRLSSEVEARFTSVERICYYINNLASEATTVVDSNRPPDDWPSSGTIQFSGLKMRYRPNLPLVLKGVTFTIESEEKIGIVGRTGSGKSSLGVSLFRLVEKSAGSIIIDGIDISKIGLEDLRSKISIIPQDPVLFVGTIRYNLDPFDQYSDAQIWRALERTYMKESIVNLNKQLKTTVVENGENFSVGERQLLCMARALLRSSKILILDEATAAIDTETDSLVQATIREAFRSCTMLTIAHRLNTILDCDKIMVLNDGKVVEFDKPSSLLLDGNSVFSEMMAATKSLQQEVL
ncbi:ATP-binding cassette sub-family C member 5-like isoform X2 [Antedon mediterranea]